MAMEEREAGRAPEVLRPRDAAEACRLKAAFGYDGVFVAGGTLLRTQWESGAAALPGRLIDLTAIPGLDGIRAENGELVIGPLVKLTALMRAEPVAAGVPLLAEAARRIGAPSIRNLGTIGGNVAGRIGDTLPVLLVCGAELIWCTAERKEEVMPLEDWLADPGPADSVRLLTGIRIRLPKAAETAGRPVGAFRKLGRREAFIPSLVSVALLGRLAEDGSLRDVRIAAGGGSMVPSRLRGAEAALEGAGIGPDSLARLTEAVLDEYRPASDAFAGADYRRMAAANLIAAEWLRLAGAGREDGR
jgi:carbon-monoxide dehydrogenase medium subunit